MDARVHLYFNCFIQKWRRERDRERYLERKKERKKEREKVCLVGEMWFGERKRKIKRDLKKKKEWKK